MKSLTRMAVLVGFVWAVPMPFQTTTDRGRVPAWSPDGHIIVLYRDLVAQHFDANGLSNMPVWPPVEVTEWLIRGDAAMAASCVVPTSRIGRGSFMDLRMGSQPGFWLTDAEAT